MRKVEHEISHANSGIVMQYDEAGNHRMVAPDGKATEWAPYSAYTALRVKGQLWVGCTDYYITGGGVHSADDFLTSTAYAG